MDGNSSTSNTGYKGYIDDFAIYDIALEKPNVTLNYGRKYLKNGNSVDLDVNVKNANLDSAVLHAKTTLFDTDFVWTSSDESVATVDNTGFVTTKAVGTTTISCINQIAGIKMYCTIYVYDDENEEYYTLLEQHTLVYSSFENDGSTGLPLEDLQNEEYSSMASGSIATTNTNAKVGNKSCYFNGNTGQRLRLNRSNLNFGTKDFTVEFWSYSLSQNVSYPTFFANDNNSDIVFFCADNHSGDNIALQANATRILNTNKPYRQNEWINYKVVRKSGVFIIYENDKEIGRNASNTSTNIDLSALAIGR